jgi:hypothetical protein
MQTRGVHGLFDVLALVARPAAGKSEIMDYLRRTPDDERRRRFHVGRLREIDDFPMLWTWFEEDRILADMGLARLHTDGEGYFRFRELWDVLIRRICLEYAKALAERPALHADTTVLLEFSRGTEHGGYRSAFAQIDSSILRRAAVLYVDVSYEESLRKNRARFDPDRPHSILAHALPDDKLERLYREVDWGDLVAGRSEFFTVGGVQVPYVVMPNEDDVTTGRGEALGARLEEVLGRLWRLYSASRQPEETR